MSFLFYEIKRRVIADILDKNLKSFWDHSIKDRDMGKGFTRKPK